MSIICTTLEGNAMPTGTEPIPPSALQRLGAQLAELLDDDHWNNIESNYLLPALEELEQAKRDALPCQVLDVLDSERRAKAKADRYREALERVNKTLTVPAAEYVPAIQDAFQIIDTALAG